MKEWHWQHVPLGPAWGATRPGYPGRGVGGHFECGQARVKDRQVLVSKFKRGVNAKQTVLDLLKGGLAQNGKVLPPPVESLPCDNKCLQMRLAALHLPLSAASVLNQCIPVDVQIECVGVHLLRRPSGPVEGHEASFGRDCCAGLLSSMQTHWYASLLVPWCHSSFPPAGLLLKIAILLTGLYEQPGGTASPGPMSTILTNLPTSTPARRAASCTAAKHSLCSASRWPAGHSLALRVQADVRDEVRAGSSSVPRKAAGGRAVGTADSSVSMVPRWRSPVWKPKTWC
eukprot:scaffold95233_cov74-Phaeocystis_antarctica.AAC.4